MAWHGRTMNDVARLRRLAKRTIAARVRGVAEPQLAHCNSPWFCSGASTMERLPRLRAAPHRPTEDHGAAAVTAGCARGFDAVDHDRTMLRANWMPIAPGGRRSSWLGEPARDNRVCTVPLPSTSNAGVLRGRHRTTNAHHGNERAERASFGNTGPAARLPCGRSCFDPRHSNAGVINSTLRCGCDAVVRGSQGCIMSANPS